MKEGGQCGVGFRRLPIQQPKNRSVTLNAPPTTATKHSRYGRPIWRNEPKPKPNPKPKSKKGSRTPLQLSELGANVSRYSATGMLDYLDNMGCEELVIGSDLHDEDDDDWPVYRYSDYEVNNNMFSLLVDTMIEYHDHTHHDTCPVVDDDDAHDYDHTSVVDDNDSDEDDDDVDTMIEYHDHTHHDHTAPVPDDDHDYPVVDDNDSDEDDEDEDDGDDDNDKMSFCEVGFGFGSMDGDEEGWCYVEDFTS